MGFGEIGTISDIRIGEQISELNLRFGELGKAINWTLGVGRSIFNVQLPLDNNSNA